jgi:hypothetical protein
VRRGDKGPSAAAKHPDALQGYQPGADQLFQSRKECVNPIFRIDDLDEHREIPRRLDNEFAIDPAARAKTQWAVKDSRAGQARSPRRLDDRSVEVMSLCLIGLTDERAKKDGLLR